MHEDLTILNLQIAAKIASTKAYCPYSHFPVGAAVLTGDGRIFSGCNIENASYGLTMCAERVALFSAYAAGATSVKVIVVYTPTKTLHASCGACRQVFSELCPNAELIGLCDGSAIMHVGVKELLPKPFGELK